VSTTAPASEQQQAGAAKANSFKQALKKLAEPTPKEHVKTREGWRDRNGNTHMVEYVEWHYVCDLLDEVWPYWEFSIRKIEQGQVNGHHVVYVTAAITLITPEGNRLTREGVGTGTPKGDQAQGAETAYKSAESDALKRAATKFGIGRDLYQGEAEIIPAGEGGNRGGGGYGANTPVGQIRDATAKSQGDLVTPKQLGMIRALAREAGVDEDEECERVLRCKTDSLAKKAASSFIDHLKGLGQGGGENKNPPQGAARRSGNDEPPPRDEDISDDDIPF
jgi:hypothetical protein